ncbi:EamA family transporter [Metabacillus litoralis]|uniref:EamA family transporter n=1 Tax=Metabacillus litoralis TaxID=152268 RepID=A0A5C6W8A6_9BACI|nr:EamA family transporter [Metabacillus litoralis]TXC92016.1 EamA family transporter [Metabacillus litoralis]
MQKNIAYLYILLGATLWGMIGIFVTFLYKAGFTPTQVVAIRALSACFFLLFFVLIKNREMLKIKVADSKYFIGTGIVSIVFFNWCLFNSIEETSISIASILLYTAPAFVTILSRIVFKELLTFRKVLALLLTFLGCMLVIGLYPSSSQAISVYGLILGIGSGLFYAMYSIFGKLALKKYKSLTVTVYTFIFASVGILPFSQLWNVLDLFQHVNVWFYIIGLGFLSTVLAYTFYTRGLETVESSRASILATVEPVVASLMGFLFFQEKLSGWQYIGIILVIIAVIVVQERRSGDTLRPSLTKQAL